MKHLLLLIGSVVAIVLWLTSCHSVKQACRTLDKHEIAAARYCATKYPVKEKTTVKTVYKPGKAVEVPGETVYVEYDCDSAVRAAKAGIGKTEVRSKVIRIPVPKYIQVDTAAIETNIVRESVAALAAKDLKFDSLSKQYVELNNKYIDLNNKYASALKAELKTTNRAIWGWSAFTLLAIIVAVFLWLLKKGVIK